MERWVMKRSGCGAVPVPLFGGCGDDVTGADILDVTVAGLDEAVAFGDVEGLPDGVGMPGGAGGRG
jgi:hypothetical protein